MHDNLSYQRVLTSVRSIIRLLNQKWKILILGPKQCIKTFQKLNMKLPLLKKDV